jgi:hypothetical protein
MDTCARHIAIVHKLSITRESREHENDEMNHERLVLASTVRQGRLNLASALFADWREPRVLQALGRRRSLLEAEVQRDVDKLSGFGGDVRWRRGLRLARTNLRLSSESALSMESNQQTLKMACI